MKFGDMAIPVIAAAIIFSIGKEASIVSTTQITKYIGQKD